MTMQRDRVSELFGLAGTFPRPGWVVLDAARDHRFTGELVFETPPPVRVYFERGSIYLAERISDPSLGARLVDAGALTAVQLERGSVRVGEVEHLGRLFERVPALDRHTVVVTAELMTEECVRWLASQRVSDVGSTPYRHHDSGVHLWNRPAGRVDLSPGDALPAPAPDEPPVALAPPDEDGTTRDLDPFLDGLIEWEEPTWLDRSQLEREVSSPAIPAPADSPADDSDGASDENATDDLDTVHHGLPTMPVGEAGMDDWVDRLETEGLPGEDPLAAPMALPRLPVEPVDHFELVWPSGEVDEQFGDVESVAGDGHDPDADRVGSTARLARSAAEPTPPPTVDAETAAVTAATDALTDAVTDADTDDVTDEVVLAVRRAVASIEVGSLAARQRLADRHGLGEVRSGADAADPSVPEPGRVAVRSGRNDWSRRTVTRSVFDEPVVVPESPDPEPPAPSDEHRDERAGALRRLISSLRR